MKINNKKYICFFLILFITLISTTVISATQLDEADYDGTANSVVAIEDNSEINVNNVNEINENNNEYKELTKNEKDIKQANRYTYFNYYADSQHAKEYENNDLYTTVGKEESLYITVENSMSSSSPLTTEGNITVYYQDKILGKVTNPNSGTQPITFSFDEAGTYDLTVEFTTPSGYFDGTQEFTVYVQGSTPVEKNTSITLSLDKTTNDINETFQILVSILPKNATGTVTIYLDDSALGQLETKSNDFGVNIALPYAGSYELTATYTSNNTNLYEDSQTTTSLPITINAIDTTINADSIIYNKDSKTTTIKLTDANSNPVSNQKMDFIIYDTSNNIISNITTDATDSEGNVEVTLPDNLEVGSYNVVVNYNGGQWKTKKVSEYTTADDLVHEASTAQTTLTVEEVVPVEKNTTVTLSMDNNEVGINETITLHVSMQPKNATGTITIYLDDSALGQLETKSNDFGVNIALPYAGSYEFTATYTSNNTDLYEDSQTTAALPITVKAIDTIITANPVETPLNQATTTTVNLKDANSNAVTNQQVNALIYDANENLISNITTEKSDENGNIEIQIPDTLDEGTYNLIINYAGGQWKTKKVSEYTTADDLIHEASTAQTTITVTQSKIPTEIEMIVEDIKLKEGETKTVIINTNPQVNQGVVTVKKSSDIIATVDLSTSNSFDITDNLPSYYYPYNLVLSYEDDAGDYKASDVTMKVEKKTYNSNTYFNYYADSEHQVEYDTNSLDTLVGKEESLYITVENSYSSSSPLTTEGNITVTLGDEVIDKFTNPNSGSHEIKLSFDQTGVYVLTVEFETQSGYYNGIQEFTVNVLDKLPTQIELSVDDIKIMEGQTKTVTITTNPEVQQGIVTVKKSNDIIATVDLSTDNTFDVVYNSNYYYPITLTLSYVDDAGDYKASDVTMKVEKKTYNSNTYFNYYADSEHQVEYDTNSLDTLVGKEESLYITVENSYSSSSPLTTEGNITVTLGDEVIDKFTNPNSGSHEVKLSFDKAGTYTLVVEFETQTGYYNGIQEFTVNVEDKKEATPITLNIEDVTGDYGQTKTVTINTNPEVQQGIITIKDQEETIKTMDLSADNTFDIELTKMTEGSYQLTISYYDESEDYKAEDTTITVTINDARKETLITMEDVVGLINKTVTITAKVTDDQLNDITEGNVVFTNQDGDVLGQASVNNAIATITLTFDKDLTTQITASYTSDNILIKPASTTATLTINKKLKTSIIVNEFNLTVGQKNNITVNVIDENNNNVTSGKVAFKINGKTVKDSNGKVIYAKVTNGQATLEDYEIPDELINKNLTLSVVYAGSTGYESSKINNVPINITQSQKTLSIEKINDNVTVGSTITFKATLNSEKPVNTGKVVFKINGKTVKDSNGKVVYALVTNGVATVDYEIPNTLKSKNYTITAVYIDNNNERLEDSTNLTIINS